LPDRQRSPRVLTARGRSEAIGGARRLFSYLSSSAYEPGRQAASMSPPPARPCASAP
jgi:hypothetical protein